MKKYVPYLLFLSLTLAIMLPLYKPGFIFLLDMVWGPEIQLSDYLLSGLSAGWPLILLFKFISFWLPVSVIQKILLSLLLFGAGTSMYALAKRYAASYWAMLAGVFYMINPWVYERLLAGQWRVLAGYVLLPIIVKLGLTWLDHLTLRKFIPLAVLFSLYPLLSLHWAYISIFLLGLLLLISLWQRKLQLRKVKILKLSAYGLAFLGFYVLVNAFWLLDFFQASSAFTSITLHDLAAYQTVSDVRWGPYVNVLALYGFWNTEFFLPKDTLSLWWLVSFIILLLTGLGAWPLAKRHDRLSLALAIIFIPTLLVGVGMSSQLTRPLSQGLFLLVPGFQGLRDTQKIVGLLAFTYALLAPLGARYLLEFMQQHVAWLRWQTSQLLFFIFIFLLPVLGSHTIFWGFQGQLRPADYPASWYQANSLLSQPADKILFLPWHGYLSFSFTSYKRIANPARVFFTAPVVAGQNIDNVFLLERESTDWDQVIFRLVHGFDTLADKLDFFQQENISHIVLVKEVDWERYDFLNNSSHVSRVFDRAELIVYELKY